MQSCFHRAWCTGIGVTSIAASLWACGATRLGATDVDLARGRDRASQGATVFAQECARCHGERGEGLAGASAILGPGALPEFPRDLSGPTAIQDPQQITIQVQTRPAGAPWRDPFRNAQDLYDFTSNHMPKARAEILTQEHYWAVVNFIVVVQGGKVPDGGINAANASSVPIPHP